MFDLTSSKLLILAIVALLVVGPKDFPLLLRTVGKYLGMIRRQAAEFRSQFNEAINEAEMAELRKELESVSEQVETTMREGGAAIDSQLDDARHGIDSALDEVKRDVGVPVGSGPPPAAALPPPGEDPASEAAESEPHVTEKTGT
jgi:sec-independent protein translocase protein TatB